MCQNVGVALHDLVIREAPVLLSGSCVMVIDECDCLLGIPPCTNQPSKLHTCCFMQTIMFQRPSESGSEYTNTNKQGGLHAHPPISPAGLP